MATAMEEIAEAIQSIEAKKQSLKESFENLQKHSQFFSSFSLSWPEIDSHFSQIQSSLQSRFSIIQNNNKEQSLPQNKQNPENPVGKKTQKVIKKKQKEQSLQQSEQNPENPVGKKSQKQSKKDQKEQSFQQSERNPENPIEENPKKDENIKEMCEKMESAKLRNWVKDNAKLKDGVLSELGLALKLAPDPFKLVLDAIEGIHPKGKCCVVLCEGLMMVEGLSVSVEMRERAKGLALKWKGELNMDGKYPMDVLGFLSLLGCFGLVEEFSKDEILECVYSTAKFARAAKLCRVLGLEEKVPDLVQKLVSNGGQLMAIKFVYEFKLIDKFPPTEILKSFLKDAKKIAKQLRKGKNLPKSLGQGDEKELSALKTVLKYIGDYDLAPQYPKEGIEQRINQLERLKANRKGTQPIQPPQQKPNEQKRKLPKQQLLGRKKQAITHVYTVENAMQGIPISAGDNSLPSSQQPYSQPLVSPPVLPGLGVHSSVGPQAVSGPMPYDTYGLATSILSYALGSQLPSSSYTGPNPLQGYGFPPQNHPSNHPQ